MIVAEPEVPRRPDWLAWEKAVRASRGYRNPHITRHTYATEYLRRGGAIEKLSRILGHSSVEITDQAYGHLVTEDLAADVERVQKWLDRQDVTGRTPVLMECRGQREDRELELEFRRICDGANFGGVQMAFEPQFVAKQANVPGLQIADLIARPIGRAVLDPAQPNRAYEVIEPKLDRNPGGSVQGWGLKVFP